MRTDGFFPNKILESRRLDDPVARDAVWTDPKAVPLLLSKETFIGPVWEPACGTGAISSPLTAAGLRVWSSDLYDWGYGLVGVDFLSSPALSYPNIITNPPFRKAQEFMERAVSLYERKVAFLMPLRYLESERRVTFFRSSNLARVWVHTKRLQMMSADGRLHQRMTCYAWYIWDRTWPPGHPPVLNWV